MHDGPADLVSSAEKTMESELSSTIRESSQDWLTIAMDPFHDRPVPATGAPVNGGIASIVEVISEVLVIDAPVHAITGLPADDYDVNIAFTNLATTFPILTGEISAPPPLAGLGTVPTIGLTSVPPAPFRLASSNTMGAVTVSATVSGRPTFPSNTAAKNASFVNDPYLTVRGISPVEVQADGSVARDLMDGRARVIAAGFEVRQITRVLDIAGGAIAYQMPSQPQELILQDDNGYVVPITTQRAPPSTYADATLLPGGVPLLGSEGAYVVAPINDPSFQALQPTANLRVLSGGDYMPGSYGFGVVAEPLQNVWSGAAGGSVTLTHTNGFTGRGYYIRSVRGALQINVKFIVERFPTLDDPAVLLVARPAAVHDPETLSVYLNTMARAPVGFPVRDNILGLAFARTVGSLVVPKVKDMGMRVLSSVAASAKKTASSAASAAAKAAKAAAIREAKALMGPRPPRTPPTPRGRKKKRK
jgi:hypothetical protein